MQHQRVRRTLALLLVSLAGLSCVDALEGDAATTRDPAPSSAVVRPDAGRVHSAPDVAQSTPATLPSRDAAVAAAPPGVDASVAASMPSSDAGATDSAETAMLPTGTSSPSCRFSLWPEPDAAVVDYYCWPSPNATECLCNGTLERFEKRDPAQCMQAIAEFCRVDTGTRTYCEHFQGGSGGGCWPSEGENRWLCDCQLDGPRQVVQGASCQEAGEALCARPVTATDCEDTTGRCKPSAAGQFSCECVSDAPARHELTATECRAALRTACVTTVTPQGSQDECSTPGFEQNASPAGFCTGKGRSPSDGYECQCNLPKQGLRQAKVMAASCQQALVYSCPEAVVADPP